MNQSCQRVLFYVKLMLSNRLCASIWNISFDKLEVLFAIVFYRIPHSFFIQLLLLVLFLTMNLHQLTDILRPMNFAWFLDLLTVALIIFPLSLLLSWFNRNWSSRQLNRLFSCCWHLINEFYFYFWSSLANCYWVQDGLNFIAWYYSCGLKREKRFCLRIGRSIFVQFELDY